MGEYLQKKYLAHLKPVADTVTSFYVCPANNTCIVDSIFVNNLDYQNKSDMVSIWIVKSGQTAADDNTLLNHYELKIGENILKDKIILEHGDFISVRSVEGTTNFLLFGSLDPWSATIAVYKDEVKNGDLTHAAQLALLTGGAYQVNNNSCP